MSQGQSGFRGSIEGASIADLVQMECLSGQKRAVRVTNENEVGYLFFEAGSVTHALTSELVGEAAALEILGWTSGDFQPCQASWPRMASIEIPFQGLLMRAAQKRDESGRHSVLHLVRTEAAEEADALPLGNPKRRPVVEELAEQDVLEMIEIELPEGVFGVVSLDANGDVRERLGTVDEDFADTLALTVQLATRLGEALGLEELKTIESSGTHFRTHLLRGPEASLFGGFAAAQVEPKLLAEAVKRAAQS